MEPINLYEECVLHNCRMKNIICCIEETSELTKVLTKNLRMSPKFSMDKLKEEIAHVLLMCNVLIAEYGISDEEISRLQQDAVRRMKEDEE